MSAREYVKESIRNGKKMLREQRQTIVDVKRMLENEGRQLPSGTITQRRQERRQMAMTTRATRATVTDKYGD